MFVSIPRGEDLMEIQLDRAIELIDEKLKENAPIATYDGLDVTKGKGRFGPFIKWNDMFINVPKRYDFDNLSQADIIELVEDKIRKEKEKVVQNRSEERRVGKESRTRGEEHREERKSREGDE